MNINNQNRSYFCRQHSSWNHNWYLTNCIIYYSLFVHLDITILQLNEIVFKSVVWKKGDESFQKIPSWVWMLDWTQVLSHHSRVCYPVRHSTSTLIVFFRSCSFFYLKYLIMLELKNNKLYYFVNVLSYAGVLNSGRGLGGGSQFLKKLQDFFVQVTKIRQNCSFYLDFNQFKNAILFLHILF